MYIGGIYRLPMRADNTIQKHETWTYLIIPQRSAKLDFGLEALNINQLNGISSKYIIISTHNNLKTSSTIYIY